MRPEFLRFSGVSPSDFEENRPAEERLAGLTNHFFSQLVTGHDTRILRNSKSRPLRHFGRTVLRGPGRAGEDAVNGFWQ